MRSGVRFPLPLQVKIEKSFLFTTGMNDVSHFLGAIPNIPTKLKQRKLLFLFITISKTKRDENVQVRNQRCRRRHRCKAFGRRYDKYLHQGLQNQ